MGAGSSFFVAKPFQHSKAAEDRYESSGYTSVVSRRDCCARCDHMRMRGYNPFCDLHKIFVQKFGICAEIRSK